MPSISARALGNETPSRRRPNANQVNEFPRFFTAAVSTSGTHISAFCGNEKPSGMMPTMVVGMPFNRNGATDGGGVLGVAALPESMVQQCDGRGAGVLIGGRKLAAQDRLDTGGQGTCRR